MSDPSQGGAPPPRRAPTRGDSRAPVATITVLAIAAVAVIAGFLILHSVTRRPAAGEAGAGAPAASVTASSAPPTSAATTTSTTAAPTTTTSTTTAPGPAKTDAVVVVANASGVGGSATKMTAQLAANGYTTAPVANATGPRLDHSVIYYVPTDPAAQGVARLIAAQIPSAQTLPLPNPPPLDRPLNKATVVLMLGRDTAGRPLAQLQTG
jgi:LytR cell envelope-related transcriptional attenuator